VTTPSSEPRSTGPGPPDVTPRRDPTRPFATSPFARLARTHAFGIAGDALFAIALAGSVFFSLDFNSARWSVALYLVLTIAPFAVAAPFIGPALDRIPGGRKWMIVAGMGLRALLCFFVIRHLNSILFYPEAFLMLVLGKTYTISKSAIVPTTVRSDQELVEANSKLAVISAIAVVVAAPFAGALLKLGGPGWALGLAVIVFAVATGFALQLPQAVVATQPVDEAEKQELRSAGITLAASAMGLVRAIVGFVAFMLAFDFKNSGAPLWQLGFVAATAQLGFFLGAVIAPRVRRFASEERIIIGTLVVMAVGGLVTAVVGGLVGAATISLIIGAASSMAKQAFDAIVQRDAPDANRGRSFARFETRFQLLWVIGALIPILIPIPAEIGYVFLAAVALFAVISYLVGVSKVRKGANASSVAPSTPAEARETGAPPGPPAGPLPPRPQPPGIGARRWVTAPAPNWEPPPGFVAHPLGEEPTLADDAAAPAPVAPVVVEQPELPLDATVPEVSLDPTVGERPPATEVYPEPPWRNADAPTADSTDDGPG
jgi:MFS family permease